MNNHLYTKDIDFFDLITIFLRYKIIILILTLGIPAIISISYSYNSYQNEIKYPKNKYRAVTRVYSYPSIKTNDVTILFPDQMFYLSYLDSLDTVPMEIRNQFRTSIDSFDLIESTLNFGDAIPLFDMFLNFSYLTSSTLDVSTYNRLKNSFSTETINFNTDSSKSLLTPSGLTLSVEGMDEEYLKEFLSHKLNKSYSQLLRHFRIQINAVVENLELENMVVSKNHDRIYELRLRYLREQLNYARINNIEDAGLMEYEYIDMPYFYKGVKNIEAEINDLQSSLKSYDYIPEIVNNKMLINRIKDLDLYKFVHSDKDPFNKDDRIIFYDLDNILITNIETNKLYDMTLLFYSILFSFLFSLFVAFLLYSYQRHLFNRNN